MSLERNGRTYGDIKLIGDDGDDFLQKPAEEQALDLGWSEACPIAPDLIQKRGAQDMVTRYSIVIFWQKYLVEELNSMGYDNLADELTQTRSRQADEPLGEHTDDWTPQELETTVFRSLASYALPRILVEYLSLEDESRFWDNLNYAMLHFRDGAWVASNQNELVVFFAEDLARNLVALNRPEDAKQILKKLLGTGKLKEDNIETDYQEILGIMQREPTLSKIYSSLSPDELDKLGIYRQSQ